MSHVHCFSLVSLQEAQQTEFDEKEYKYQIQNVGWWLQIPVTPREYRLIGLNLGVVASGRGGPSNLGEFVL